MTFGIGIFKSEKDLYTGSWKFGKNFITHWTRWFWTNPTRIKSCLRSGGILANLSVGSSTVDLPLLSLKYSYGFSSDIVYFWGIDFIDYKWFHRSWTFVLFVVTLRKPSLICFLHCNCVTLLYYQVVGLWDMHFVCQDSFPSLFNVWFNAELPN